MKYLAAQIALILVVISTVCFAQDSNFSPDGQQIPAPMLRFGIYASRRPLLGQTVWTIVNRNDYDVEGDQMQIPSLVP